MDDLKWQIFNFSHLVYKVSKKLLFIATRIDISSYHHVLFYSICGSYKTHVRPRFLQFVAYLAISPGELSKNSISNFNNSEGIEYGKLKALKKSLNLISTLIYEMTHISYSYFLSKLFLIYFTDSIVVRLI